MCFQKLPAEMFMKEKEPTEANIEAMLLSDEHSITQNFILWSMYDWSARGQEWCASQDWFQSVFKYLIDPYMLLDSRVLEIGCGAGFWSAKLAERSNALYLVDIVPSCIELSKERLAGHDHIYYHLTQGNSLDFLTEKAIDFVFSWNTFVHINDSDTLVYLKEIHRVLMSGGYAIIHHPAIGNTKPELGWRSSVTSALFKELAEQEGFTVLHQLNSWGEENQFRLWSNLPVEKCVDVVSVLKRI